MVVFNNSQKAFQWLIDNPQKRLYSKDGVYVIYNPYNTQIEYHYDFMNECGWGSDSEKMDEDEFVERFKNIELSDE